MLVPRVERVTLAEVMVFAPINLAAVVHSVTDTEAVMCGATLVPTMGPWFRRRFELRRPQERTCGHAGHPDQIQSDGNVQPIIISGFSRRPAAKKRSEKELRDLGIE